MLLTRKRRTRPLFAERLEDRRLLAGLVNGDFETGDLSGWTTFTTGQGSIGGPNTPDVVLFDIDSDRVRTETARFNVGQRGPFQQGNKQGGGIFQEFTASGEIIVGADIASDNSGKNQNAAGGEISLLIDGVVVDSFDFGRIGSRAIETATLQATVTVAPGTHELRILMTRPFLRAESITPFQMVDNVVVETSNSPPVAEDDAATTDEDVAVTVDVAANDSDPDANLDVTSTTTVSGPANGSLVNHGDGTFTYTPNLNFNGVDSFTYEIGDTDGATDTATVTITVNSVVDAQVDVKPGNGNEVDPINLGSKGKTPVAILATSTDDGELDDFDPLLIDLALISFEVNGSPIVADKLSLADVDDDGDTDLLIHFRTEDLAEILSEDSSEFHLTAEFGGAAIGADLAGSDEIKIVPKKGKKK